MNGIYFDLWALQIWLKCPSPGVKSIVDLLRREHRTITILPPPDRQSWLQEGKA